MQRTLALVKPDAYAAGHTGAILAEIQKAGLTVLSSKTLQLTDAQARGFYHVHTERPFFGALVKFMTEGKILALALEGENAIARWRTLMGPTDPKKAGGETIRAKFGTDIERNATHGSDAEDTARFEVGYFFAGLELV
jgi:nucleoside-diphosphate kinase